MWRSLEKTWGSETFLHIGGGFFSNSLAGFDASSWWATQEHGLLNTQRVANNRFTHNESRKQEHKEESGERKLLRSRRAALGRLSVC